MVFRHDYYCPALMFRLVSLLQTQLTNRNLSAPKEESHFPDYVRQGHMFTFCL